MSGATVVIALGTLVSAAAIGLQLGEMKKGGLDTKAIADAAQQQVCAANRFANSADKINVGIGQAVAKLQSQAEKMDTARVSAEKDSTKALQATISNFHEQQRAWVSITEIRKVDEYYTVSYANYGQSPAVNVHVFRGDTVQDIALVPEHDREEDSAPQRGTLLPRVPALLEVVPTASDNLKTHQQGVGVYMFGTIWYDDVFGAHHWSQYCFEIKEDQKERFDTDACSKHNAIDDYPQPRSRHRSS